MEKKNSIFADRGRKSILTFVLWNFGPAALTPICYAIFNAPSPDHWQLPIPMKYLIFPIDKIDNLIINHFQCLECFIKLTIIWDFMLVFSSNCQSRRFSSLGFMVLCCFTLECVIPWTLLCWI